MRRGCQNNGRRGVLTAKTYTTADDAGTVDVRQVGVVHDLLQVSDVAVHEDTGRLLGSFGGEVGRVASARSR